MRITTEMMVATAIQDLEANQNRLATAQQQLASGQQFSTVADNPNAAEQVMALNTMLASNTQYLKNLDGANAWLSSTDSALQGVDTALTRAQQLAVEGANGTLSASDRSNIAAEVDSLVGEVVQLGNSTYLGSYIFGGSSTTSPPFAYTNGVVVYNNSDSSTSTSQLPRAIGPGEQIVVNTIGHDPTTQQGLFDQVLGALTTFSQALHANDTTAIQSSIQQIGTVQQTLAQAEATVGATMDRVSTNQDQLNALQNQLQTLRSSLQDTNFAEASTNYSEASVVNQATLATISKTIPPSLFSYMA